MSLLKDYWWVLLIGFTIGSAVVAQQIEQKTLKTRTVTIAEGVEQLQKIHIEEDAEERGKQQAIEELCDDGRLTGDICDED